MDRSDNRFRTELRALIPRLRRFGHALTGNPDDGDDLVQDALERALVREDQFRIGTRLDSWVYKIMQNAWIDRRRNASRRGRVIQPMDDESYAVVGQADDGSESRIRLRRVRDMMTRLHDNERDVLVLVSLEGLSYRETADMLGIPIGTVMSRLARARDRLLQLVDGVSTQNGEDQP